MEKSGDVDSFAVELAAGQTLVASVEAYTLMSPLDAVLRLVDPRGVVLAMEHDDGRTFDPLLTWTARSAGRHIVQVFGFAYPAESEVRFTGNAKCVYRLHLSGGPVVSHTVPLGVRRGVRTPLRAFGWNLGKDADREVVSEAVPAASDATRTEFLFPGADRAIVLPVGDGPESVESEPNGTPAQANRIEIPGAVTGRIADAGDEDRGRRPPGAGPRKRPAGARGLLGVPEAEARLPAPPPAPHHPPPHARTDCTWFTPGSHLTYT